MPNQSRRQGHEAALKSGVRVGRADAGRNRLERIPAMARALSPIARKR
jgi:hypothetical protein